MEKYRGKTLEEWKKYIKEDKQIGIRTTKYILVLEELVEELQSKLHQPTVIGRFCKECGNAKMLQGNGIIEPLCTCNTKSKTCL